MCCHLARDAGPHSRLSYVPEPPVKLAAEVTLLVAHGAGAFRLGGEKLRSSVTENRLNLLEVGLVEAQRFSERSVAAGPAFLLLVSIVETRVDPRHKVALLYLWHAKGRVSVLEVSRLKTVVDQPHRLLQGLSNG